jgi:aromatase
MTASTENTVTVDAPMDVVWRMTNDVANWADLFTEYAAAEVLDEADGVIRFRLTMHPDEQGRVWSWISERTPDPATRTVSSKRVETGPFEFMHIFWEYVEGADGVTMRWSQEFAMKPTAPVDDAGMAERINRNTPIQMTVIKERIEAAYRGAGHRGAGLNV